MARMIGVDPEGLSVRELIALLEKCPDQDAWVVVPETPALDNYRHDPHHNLVAVRATGSASVELVVAEARGWY